MWDSLSRDISSTSGTVGSVLSFVGNHFVGTSGSARCSVWVGEWVIVGKGLVSYLRLVGVIFTRGWCLTGAVLVSCFYACFFVWCVGFGHAGK